MIDGASGREGASPTATPDAVADATQRVTPGDPLALAPEVVENFVAILDGSDFAEELRILGVGKWNFLRRKQMVGELEGAYTGLWYLALCRSFPQHADAIFDLLMERHAVRHPDRVGAHYRERAAQYRDMFGLAGDQNFSMVSEHLLSFQHGDSQKRKAQSLRLALCLRSTYTMIFDRLV